MITINPDLCKKDALCVMECPVSILAMENSESIPTLVEGGEESCLRCGHCVAVCPHGALDHEDTPLADCPKIERDKIIDKEQVAQFLRTRRSTRVFKEKVVEKETIEQLINIARYAPTGSNLQKVEWVVFNDRDKLKEIGTIIIDWMRETIKTNPDVPPYLPRMVAAWDAGYDLILRKAPVVVLAMADKEVRNGTVDTAIALTYLDLAAPSLGLGTCWAGILQWAMLNCPAVKEAMGISDEYPYHYPMLLGYNKMKYHRMIERKAPQISWRSHGKEPNFHRCCALSGYVQNFFRDL